MKTVSSSIQVVGAVLALLCGELQAHAFTLVGRVPQPQTPPPAIPVPAGYGNYCSIVFQGGGWAFEFMGGSSSDPCGDIASRSPGGTISRSGLWSETGQNNVMVRCDQGTYIYRGAGAAFLNTVANERNKDSSCTFIVSPTALPIFGHPWGYNSALSGVAQLFNAGYGSSLFNILADTDVSLPSGFNYDLFGQPWDVSIFGQTPTPANNAWQGVYAVQVDRYGREQGHTGSYAECLAAKKGFGCVISSGTTFEGAYDWSMPEGKPLLSLNYGIVRGARNRNVQGMGCRTDWQGEVFIEYQVGSGLYSENFVACYHHLITGTSVNVGQVVLPGQVIGQIGNTGCSWGAHLDLSVIRLSNLTGVRKYDFKALPVNPNDMPTYGAPDYNAYGVNGVQGAIDPYGWAAPQNVDPLAWKFMNYKDWYPMSLTPGLDAMGAFSLDLWIPGQAPPVNK